MADRDAPDLVHIPEFGGSPICGARSVRTSVLGGITCPDCRARSTFAGMQPKDTFNPAHPIGRYLMGASFGLPGFPRIPGIWGRFRRGDGSGDAD